MRRDIRWQRPLLTLALLGILAGSFPVHSQNDLIPVSDITGGSSVFVFRGSNKAAPKKFTAYSKSQRSKTQKLETVRKISRQYVTLAKANPLRSRSKSVDPNNLPAVETIQGEAGSKMFAGVGEYYIDNNDLDNAVKFFREAVELDDKNTSAKTGLSEALVLKGNDLLVNDKPDLSRQYFEDALQYNPNNSGAYFGLGEVLSNLDKEDEAIANYEKALTLNGKLTEIYVPLGILYYQKGEIAKADEILGKALVVSPDNPETQYFLGLVRYAQNRNEEALTAFQRSSTLDPNYAEAHFYTGETLIRLGRKEAAIEEYKKALALKRGYLEAFVRLGSAYYEAENYLEAINTYKEAIKLKNDNIEAYAGLGDTYRQMKNFTDAEANYNLATIFIARNKDFSKDEAAEVYSKHGFVIGMQCDINTQKGLPCKWNAAIRSLEAAVTLTQSPEDYSNLGWAYYKSGKLDIDSGKQPEGRAKLEKGKVALQKVVNLNPPYKYIEAPLFNLGLTLLDLGDYPGAIQYLQRVVDKKPDWGFANNELGAAYYEAKNYKEAAKYFRKVVDKDDKFARGFYNLARSEFNAGNKGEAKKAYEKLKKLSPILALQLEREVPGIK
jgi:tetratricopeptide (TPR) repeat protein